MLDDLLSNFTRVDLQSNFSNCVDFFLSMRTFLLQIATGGDNVMCRILLFCLCHHTFSKVLDGFS